MEAEKKGKLILRREVRLTPKNARTSEAEANAHFVKCFAERKALIVAIAAGKPHDDEDNHIDTYRHFDLEGYVSRVMNMGGSVG